MAVYQTISFELYCKGVFVLRKILKVLLCTLPVLFTNPASADVEVNFIEGAPKDRFVITNTGECDLDNVNVIIDLSQSVGKLIFDTTGSGAGVEVFQPFEVTSGSIKSNNAVKDGETTLDLLIASFLSGETASFTIDVDDTLQNSDLGNIRVAGSEMSNGKVTVILQDQSDVSALFNTDNTATVAIAPCTSQ